MSSSLSRGLLAIAALALPLSALAQDASCEFAQVAQAPLQYSGPGLDLTTSGEINGKPALILLISGNERTYLTRTGIKRHGLSQRPTNDYVYAGTRKVPVLHARVAEFSIGPMRASGLTLAVLGNKSFTPVFDVMAGSSFLLQRDLEISLATKELRLFRPKNCDKAWLAYWDQNASVIPFNYDGDRIHNPQFPVQVNGITLTAEINTGAPATVISKRAAQRAGLATRPSRVTAVGDGAGPDGRWIAKADTVKIGDSLVHNAELDTIDMHGDVDMMLGADFLRAHRVLFAMSQGKLYLSYLGGEPFETRSEIKPWMRHEADAGNADAWLMMADLLESGRSTTRDPAAVRDYLERAAALGQGDASLALGMRLLAQGRPEQAIARLRASMEQADAGLFPAIWLYLARLQSGDAQAGAELAAQAAKEDDWPRPVADYFLGKMDQGKLLAAAKAADRACSAARIVRLHDDILGRPSSAVLPEDCAPMRERYGLAP